MYLFPSLFQSHVHTIVITSKYIGKGHRLKRLTVCCLSIASLSLWHSRPGRIDSPAEQYFCPITVPEYSWVSKLRPHLTPGFTSLGMLVYYQTYPRTIDGSLPLFSQVVEGSPPLLSQVTPGRHMCLNPKLFPVAATPGTSRFTGLGIFLHMGTIRPHSMT